MARYVSFSRHRCLSFSSKISDYYNRRNEETTQVQAWNCCPEGNQKVPKEHRIVDQEASIYIFPSKVDAKTFFPRPCHSQQLLGSGSSAVPPPRLAPSAGPLACLVSRRLRLVDRNNGRIVATASTVEHSIKNSLECGRTCNAKAATIVGEVLAMRLKVEGLESGQERGIHVDVNKELEKKDFKNRTKVWAVINSLKNNGVKLILDENNDASHPG
ncbi:hypothetical protein L1987_34654 [Smallanthus sonchifolius]|uniref:Uncharacterized protein n=1 Tax=Smallanthus sonchifolius TaxID=185202 RepID=A0ACB9HVV8_9ASTR|nr:hypothetical protein L1987_34654 [Smallanthus sonchifolius]